jgi:hypothetical protein
MKRSERATNIEHVTWAPRFTVGRPLPPQATEHLAAPGMWPPQADALFTTGTRLQRVAAARGGTVSLLVLQTIDLPEVEAVFGLKATERVVDFVLTELMRICAREGCAFRTSVDTFALLMPAMSGQDIHRALQARLGKGCVIELEIDGHELLVVPDLVVRTISKSESVRSAFESMCRMLSAERRMNFNVRQYASHESEVRTVPMPVPPPVHLAAANETYSFPATVRMGIAG